MSRIPLAVISRLPLYYEYIVHMEMQGSRWVSSNMMASTLGLTPSTIRQDIKYLDRIESSSFGYSITSFREVLEKVLGISAGANMALVGVGSLGHALVRYRGFKDKKFVFRALFDNDESLFDGNIDGIPIYPVGRMGEIIKRERIVIGVIATPSDVAQQVADLLVDANIRGIWNFAPINLRVPSHVAIENVNLRPSLFSLAFKMKNLDEE